MTSFDAEPWVAEWTKLAVPFEQKGAELESQGKMDEANKAYEKASMYYGVARFPVINHPAKQAAYRKCIENFRKAIRSWDPPLEIVEIPFEGKTICRPSAEAEWSDPASGCDQNRRRGRL